MSLSFGSGGSTPRVDVPAATSLNSLTQSTILAWVYPTALAATRIIFQKRIASPTNGVQLRMTDTSGNLRYQKNRTDPDLSIIYTTNDAPLVANRWSFVAATGDTSLTSDTCHIYGGTLSSAAIERTYSSADDGTGTTTFDDSAAAAVIGNNLAQTQSWVGRLGIVAYVNRILSLQEIRSWQFRPRMIQGCVGLWRLGENGTGIQTDISGNNNHGTHTGTTLADNVPLSRLR